jgi:alkylation response protein AidB-like acyl-CoA dehydrogenase
MEKSLDAADWADAKVLVTPYKRSFTIFEGTSEIQHLVIARAISGLHLT